MVNYYYTALPPSRLPRNWRILLFNTNWKEVHCRKAGRNPKCSFKTGEKKRRIAVYIYIYIYLFFAIYPPQVKHLTCSLTFHVFKEVTFNALFKLLQDLYAITANVVHRERCRSTWMLGFTPVCCKCTTQSLEEGHKLGDAWYSAEVQKRKSVPLGNSLVSVVCFPIFLL